MRYAVTCSRCKRDIKVTAAKPSPDGKHTVYRTESGMTMFSGWCPDCRRDYRRKNRNLEKIRAKNRSYDKTVYGVLVRRHQTCCRFGWPVGLEDFVSWSMKDNLFQFLYKQWRDGGFKKQDAPCVVRLDESKPHGFDNCTWVVFSVKQLLHPHRITKDKISAPIRRRHRTP